MISIFFKLMLQIGNERGATYSHTPSVKHNITVCVMREIVRTCMNIRKVHAFRVKLHEQHNLVARVEPICGAKY